MQTEDIQFLLKMLNTNYNGAEMHSVEIFPDGSGFLKRGETHLFTFTALEELDELDGFLRLLRTQYTWTT